METQDPTALTCTSHSSVQELTVGKSKEEETAELLHLTDLLSSLKLCICLNYFISD